MAQESTLIPPIIHNLCESHPVFTLHHFLLFQLLVKQLRDEAHPVPAVREEQRFRQVDRR